MRKILFQFRKLSGNSYILDGDSTLYTEQEVIDLIKRNQVGGTLTKDGEINTSDIIVVRDTNESDEIDVLPDNIDFNIINICAKIRKLALLDRLKFNEVEHGANNGLNTHMLNYIKYCGLTPLEFIKSYLCNLQPYMISRLKREEYHDKVICVLDNIYCISVYIKIDAT